VTRAGRRILFAVPVPEYLRFFEDVIERLRDRGHEVIIAIEREGKDAGAASRARAVARIERTPPPVRWRAFYETLATTSDYLRFMAPEFADKPYLRRRMDKYLPDRFAALRRVRTLPSGIVGAAYALSRVVERVTPGDAGLRGFLAHLQPDALVLSPLVLRGTGGARQTQLLKAARRLGIPTALAVGSWDHLSSKGFIRLAPDRVLVWNETQKREAVGYHRIDPADVRVTGAYPWDLWFRTSPSRSREAFLADVGLPADRPYVLYVGSSRGIAAPAAELAFVTDWLRTLRTASDPVVRSIGVMIRPHPTNRDHWTRAPLEELGPVRVWPLAQPALPMTPEDHATYHDSLFFSSAVVGINTSAMIEAAIVGRPVLTVRHEGVAQDETVHFAYLTREQGGSVEVADSMDAHLAQLAAALRDPAGVRERTSAFVRTFVRPQGLDQPSGDLFAAAVEELAAQSHRAAPESPARLAATQTRP
jgi:hypothetical protein